MQVRKPSNLSICLTNLQLLHSWNSSLISSKYNGDISLSHFFFRNLNNIKIYNYIIDRVFQFASWLLQFASRVLRFASWILQFASMVLQFASRVLRFASWILQFASMVLQFASRVLRFANKVL